MKANGITANLHALVLAFRPLRWARHLNDGTALPTYGSLNGTVNWVEHGSQIRTQVWLKGCETDPG
jgi:hypothetical protein